MSWQLKPDEPRQGKDGKPIKYENPTGGTIFLDVPIAAHRFLQDREAELWITEGAKKVDSAVCHGIPCTIGLSGVWLWRDGHKQMLPDWDYIDLAGRRVVIAFDSDVMVKPNVRGALEGLKRALEFRGADVRYCLMPDLADEAKRGLDDAFASGLTRADLEKMTVDSLPSAIPVALQTRRAADIQSKDIEWIWERWMPAGMLALFAGYGGSGKSTVALQIAAQCSIGGQLPDGKPAPMLNTLIFAAEDSPEHTITPRLVNLGADLSRIHIVDGIPSVNGDPSWVQLRAHVAMIEQTVHELNIGLVIIDPVSSYIGDANSDKESDVRAALTPLVKMAERTGAAVLMIRHVSKAGDGTRAASRILGSTAWHDIPRVAWMLADAPEEHQPEPHADGTRDTRRVLGVVKANLAAKPPARWCIQSVNGSIQWLPDPAPVSIDECFVTRPDRSNKGYAADEWATEYLKGGAKSSTQLFADAKDKFPEKTLRASLRRIGAESFQLSGKAHGGWYWRLPPANRSLGHADAPGAERESDDTLSQRSLSPNSQETQETATLGETVDSAPSDSRHHDSSHLVTFPVSPHGPNGKVTQEADTKSLQSTGTDEWSIEV